MHSSRHAFTLIELSIILVIIGLLAGGVLAGQSLMRAAELRSIIADANSFRTAINTFKDQYSSLPGDMPDATNVWGIAGGATGSDAACWTTDSSTAPDPKNTCNGNGDGQIGNPAGIWGVEYEYNERFRAWQHLANAGFIAGSYTGVHGGTAGVASDSWVRKRGVTNPSSKLSSAVFDMTYLGQLTGSPVFYDHIGSDNMLVVISGNNSTAAVMLFSPEEVWNLDTKLDDGKPATGKVLNVKASYIPGCTTADDATSEYNVTDPDKRCNTIMYSIE